MIHGLFSIASADLVAYYGFETGSGTIAYDQAPNPANGNINGNPQWVTGKVGNYALEFDGTGDYVKYGSVTKFDITNAITFALWVKVDSWTKWTTIAGRYHPWFIRKGQSGNLNSANWRTDGTSGGGTSNLSFAGISSIDDGQWHHVVGTYDGATGEQYIYIDGVLENSAQGDVSGQISYADTRDFAIAATGIGTECLDGLIDDVRIYNRALSQDEILAFNRHTASNPTPVDNGLTSTDVILSWSPGVDANSHDVYFGTSLSEVTAANNSWDVNTTVYKGNRDSNSYNPGTLELGKTYYWRIDEVNNILFDKFWRGDIWSFWVFDSNQLPDWCKNGYGLWIEDSMTQVFPASRPDGDANNCPEDPNVSISLARGEYESFQLVILPAPGKAMSNVTVETSDLVKGGDTIDANNIEWHVVGYVEITNAYVECKASFIDDAAPNNGWWPDPLLPVSSFDVDSNNAQPIWVTVYAPNNTPAGEYTGTLTIVTDSGLPTEVDLTVKVYGFTLAKGAGHCRTAFTLFPLSNYGCDVINVSEFYWEYAEFMLKHRLNPDNLYHHEINTPNIPDLEHFYELGMNSYNIECAQEYSMSFDVVDAFLSDLENSPYGEQLREMAYFYGYDEINADRFEEMRNFFAKLEANYPDIERLTTARLDYYWADDPAGAMDSNYVDWMCPLTPRYKFDVGEELRQQSHQLWAYVCASPKNNQYANFFVKYPVIESRVLWWQMYHQKMDGFLYYCVNCWRYGTTAIDPEEGQFTNFVFHRIPQGDGELMYPGVNGPIGSIRLANIRDGIEDYEYLWMLADRAGSVETVRQKVRESVTWSLRYDPSYTHDSNRLQTARNDIAEMLSSSKAILPRPADGAKCIAPNDDVLLIWTPGKDANSHDVYFGTDFNDVNDAGRQAGDADGNCYVDWNDLAVLAQQWLDGPGTSEPSADLDDDGDVDLVDFAIVANDWMEGGNVIFKGNQDANSYNPGTLELDKTYYWRIDEVNGSNTIKGNLWSFTTGNLIGHWKFDDGSGVTAADSSGNGLVGTLNGDPNWVTGKVGNYALDFDGDGDLVDCGNDKLLDITDAITVTAWVKISAWDKKWQTIVSRYHSWSIRRDTTATYWGLPQRGAFGFFTKGTGQPHETFATTPLDDGQWHHVAATYDGATGKQYVYTDGTLEGSTQGTVGASMNVDQGEDLAIGAQYSTGQVSFHGLIDDVRIYNRAITASDINDIYKEGL